MPTNTKKKQRKKLLELKNGRNKTTHFKTRPNQNLTIFCSAIVVVLLLFFILFVCWERKWFIVDQTGRLNVEHIPYIQVESRIHAALDGGLDSAWIHSYPPHRHAPIVELRCLGRNLARDYPVEGQFQTENFCIELIEHTLALSHSGFGIPICICR